MRKLKVTGKNYFLKFILRYGLPFTKHYLHKMFPRKLHKQFVKKPVLDVENDWESKQDLMPLSSNSDSPVFSENFLVLLH